MNICKLTKIIEGQYNNCKNEQSVMRVEPLIKLSNLQLELLNAGDGQTPGQYKQINSSTGLAVNYYKLIENSIQHLVFEDKVAVPLRQGRYANLDVSFWKGNTKYYIESKFLEPYYSGNEVNSVSYYDTTKYSDFVPHKHIWVSLFERAKRYEYYNVSQLCRHLLAIYKQSLLNEEDKRKNLILQSVTWRMPEAFLKKLSPSDQAELRERIMVIEKEKEDCQNLFDHFINEEIQWNSMKFETKHYDDSDMLQQISDSKYFDEFCTRYMIEVCKK